MVNAANKTANKIPTIGDDYYEAWYELGAPVSRPFLKYIVAVIQYLVDNYFLIKNTVNALSGIGHPDSYSSTVWVAGCTVGLHVLSSILISVLDSFNKDAITGRRRTKTIDTKCSRFGFFRTLAHITLTMKLFRYTTAYLENRRKNKELHTLRMRRTVLSRKEIQFIADQKKNSLVESHYDLIESFFKTIPAALLQVYFMFKTNPDARMRLFSTIDQDRFATVFFTIITASVAAVNYQFSYMEFKKVLHFQDCFRSGFQQEINLRIPGDVCFVTSIIAQIGTIGIRMCFYSIILFWSPRQFLITIVLLLLFNWILIFKCNKTSWRLRAVLENPLYGVPWLSSDVIDLWVNLFVPGVHYPKPLDYFLNFYTTTFIGVVVFRGFDFLFPTDSGTNPLFLSEDGQSRNTTGMRFNLPQALETYDVNLQLNVTNEGAKDVDEETVHLMGMIIKYLMLIHDHLTLNQISYIAFFYSVVKYMNIVNAICLCYTFAMNMFKLYDLDFPIQIANNFFRVVIEAINEPDIPKVNGLLIQTRRAEVFLLFFILPNATFFGQFPMLKNTSWKSIDEESFNRILNSVMPLLGPNKATPTCCQKVAGFFNKIYHFFSPVLYPDRYRDPEIDWEVPTTRLAVEESIQAHPLRSHLLKLIDLIHEYGDAENGKLLLAVFCSNYNEIVRHYTSLRIKKMFKFLEITLEKRDAYHNNRVAEGTTVIHFEIGFWNRLLNEMRGNVERYVWE